MLEALLEVLYPGRCAGCGRGPWPFCDACRDRVRPLAPPWCLRCGSPRWGARVTCRDCPPEPISLARAAFHFSGPVRAAVHRLKFAGWRPVARALGLAAAETWLGTGFPCEVVTWVPLSRRRRAERGFDQAEALARVVGRRLGVPVRRLLARARDDPLTQARRDRAGRLEAMRGRFTARTGVRGRVLLVDDVLTTGATASACAAALLEGGAARIGVLTAARALRLDGIVDVGSRPGLWLPGERLPGSRCQPRAKRPT